MDPIPLLCDLVAANSVNPSLVPGAAGEAEAAEVCRVAMTQAGLDVVTQVVQPGRPNAIGVLDGAAPGPTVMFCGHLDTVGVDGMTDPCVARVEHGRLYGRGAQDMKGGIAAMVAAAAVLARSWTKGRLIVAAVVDEEYGSIGAEDLVARGWRADAAIVTEPTDLAVAIGHKGFVWLEVVTRGRAAHGSRPAEGRDAIVRMGRVLGALERLDREVQQRMPEDVQGTGSLHASIIAGGRELSSYPDRCVLQMERRTVSGEDAETAVQEMERILAVLTRDDPEFDGDVRLLTHRPPYRLDRGHGLVSLLEAAIAKTGRASAPVGMSFWTDAAILAGAGIPAVLFGPGGAGLHSLTEYVNVADVYACRDILADAVTQLMGQ